MGKVKEWLLEMEEQAEDRHLAKLLDISFEDLIQLNWEINTNESDDGLVYSYVVKFKEDSPKNILAKIDRIDNNYQVYLEPWELNATYDYVNDQFDAITESRIGVKEFEKSIDEIYKLSSILKEGDDLKKLLNRQVFISIIGTLETFLSETFLRLVFENNSYFQSFIESHPIFKSQKFELRDLFKKQNEIRGIAKKVILDTIFHNLSTVSQMYKNTFEIEFPDIEKLSKFVFIRHDLVHRNGKTKDGEELAIDDELIKALIDETKDFSEKVCKELNLK